MSSMKNRFFRNTLIYFLLILGFFYLYVVDIDAILHPNQDNTVKSKVDFIYQQF